MKKYIGYLFFSLTTLILSPSCDKEQEQEQEKKEFVATKMDLGCLTGSGNITIQSQAEYEASMSITASQAYGYVGTFDSSSYPAIDFTSYTVVGVVGWRTGCGPPQITSSVESKEDIVTFNFEVPVVDPFVPTCQASVKYFVWYIISKTANSKIVFNVKGD